MKETNLIIIAGERDGKKKNRKQAFSLRLKAAERRKNNFAQRKAK